MRRLLPPLVCLAALLAVTAAQAAPKASGKDRADARAYIAAYQHAAVAAKRAVAALPDLSKPDACGGILLNAPASAHSSPVLLQAYFFGLAQAAARQVPAFSRALDRVHAHDSVLRAYAAAVRTKVLPALRPFAQAPSADVCKVAAAWKQSGYVASFDLAGALGVSQAQLRSTIDGKLIPARLQRQTEARLVAFGIPRATAHAFAGNG